MESAKRASVGNNCVASEFFFFFKKRGSKGERGKKAQDMQEEKAPTTKNNKKCNSEKSQKNFSFFIHTRQTTHLRRTLCAFKHTHTHTCFKRVNNNNNAGVHNLFPVV